MKGRACASMDFNTGAFYGAAPTQNSGIVQVALSSHLVKELAARDAPDMTGGDAVARFGAAVLATLARLIRRPDPEVSTSQCRYHLNLLIKFLARLLIISYSDYSVCMLVHKAEQHAGDNEALCASCN